MPVLHPFKFSRSTGLIGAALIALALWVQVLAPVGALRTMLSAPESLPGVILCGRAPDRGAAGDLDGLSAPATPTCALCQLCRAGLAPPPAPLAPALAHSLHWRVVAWPIPPSIHSEPATRITARPRAPPIAT